MFEDPSLGPFESTQLHDINPGDLNEPGLPNHWPFGGVFWTRDIPAVAVQTHPGSGNAAMNLTTELFDFFELANAVGRTGPAPVPATATVDVGWTGTGEKTQVTNEGEGPHSAFSAHYVNATAIVEWSATTAAGYQFSTAGSTDVTVTHAFTANMRNGVFFP